MVGKRSLAVQVIAFSIVSQSPPHCAGSSAVLTSDGNLCYRGVELRDAEESSAERASSRNCSAILLVVGMGCLNSQMGILAEACGCGCSSVNEYSAALRTLRPLLSKRRSGAASQSAAVGPASQRNLKRASLLSLY